MTNKQGKLYLLPTIHIRFLLIYNLCLMCLFNKCLSMETSPLHSDGQSQHYSIHNPVWNIVKKSWFRSASQESPDSDYLLRDAIPKRRKRTGKGDYEQRQNMAERLRNRKREGLKKPVQWNAGWAESAKLELVDGLFQGVTIKITERIAQEDCTEVMQGLQAVLREMSSTLYVATEGRAAIGRVVVLIPESWSSRSCQPPTFENENYLVNAALTPQIYVDSPHTVFHDYPWTQQSRGCGFEGDFIQMGVNFLREANSSLELSERAGRIMAGEWAKYRWGVFSESGHAGDQLYPPWYLSDADWAPTICSNVRSHDTSCQHEFPHRCRWPSKSFENASSSLLSIPSLPQVTLFCSSKTHNIEAPTKHNVLCQGKPTWDVIVSSNDFVNGKNPPIRSRPPPVQTIFVRPPHLRYVLLVEDTDIMNVQRRWEFVRKAVRRTIVYDLPDDAYVSVIVFNSKPKEVAPLTKLDSVSDLRERVGSSLPRNPSTVSGSHACLSCALKAALETLREAQVSEKGANIIMITNGGQKQSDQFQAADQIIETNSFRLLLVLFPFQEYPGLSVPQHSFTTLAKQSKGVVYTVMDEGVGNDSKVNMLISLMEVLAAAVFAGGATTPVLVHFASYPGAVAPFSSGTFSLDDSLEANAKFSVYYYDLNHVGNTIHLTAPSGSTFASVSMQEEDGDVNMIFVNLQNAERGVWRYKVENRADSHQGLHIQVTSRSNPLNDVNVKLWTNQDFEEDHSTNKPTIIYGKVQVNGAPVVGAGVMATLQRLGTNATGGTYPPVQVSLLDLGTGDPDITQGDGIYSRYAPPLEGPARYALMLSVDASQAIIGQVPSVSRARTRGEHDLRHHRHAFIKEIINNGAQFQQQNMRNSAGSSSFSFGESSTFSLGYSPPHFLFSYPYYDMAATRAWDADSNFDTIPSCCGSLLKYPHTRESPSFTRQVIGPTVNVWQTRSSKQDVTPPSRITDLVAWLNASSELIHLQWTSVGDDYDWGQAHHYEGVVTPYIKKAMLQCSGSPLKGLPKPSPATMQEKALTALSISNKRKTVYVCLRAVDKSGNRGPPSNSARIWVPTSPSTDRVTVRARGSGLGGYGSSGLGDNFALISGCIGGIVLIISLVTAYFYCVPPKFKHDGKFGRRRSVSYRDNKFISGQDNIGNGGSVIVRSNSCKNGANQQDLSHNQRLALDSPLQPNDGNESPSVTDRHDLLKSSEETLRVSNLSESELDSKLPFQRDLTGSMSIPDVTKVSLNDFNINNKMQLEPQFFTLGRGYSRNDKPSYESSSNQMDRAVPAYQPVAENMKPLIGRHRHVYSDSISNILPQTSEYYNNLHRPATSQLKSSGHESDLSLYGSNSQQGDSALDILSDDRRCSPPPPAPSDPQNKVSLEFNIKRHSLGFP